MIQQNEVIIFLLGVSVLTFILANRWRIARFPAWKVLVASFCVLLVGWLLTILEGIFWEGLLNFVEHLSYALSSSLIAFWCWRVFQKGEEAQS
jgi:hypothetical protein